MTDLRRTLALAAALMAAAACSDDSTPTGIDPSVAEVAGTYVAEAGVGELLLRQSDPADPDAPLEVTDLLAVGATVEMTLRVDGGTEGRLFIPEGDEDGGDLISDFQGTWRITSEDRIELQHDSDDFIREMTFTFEDDRLVGDEDFGSYELRLVVVRRDG